MPEQKENQQTAWVCFIPYTMHRNLVTLLSSSFADPIIRSSVLKNSVTTAKTDIIMFLMTTDFIVEHHLLSLHHSLGNLKRTANVPVPLHALLRSES